MRQSWVQFWLLWIQLFFNCTQMHAVAYYLWHSILTLRVTVSSKWGSLNNPVAPVLSCIVVVCLFSWQKWYSSILKCYAASKTSRLYSFQPKLNLLPYLSITMHFIQYQGSTFSFAGYYVIPCCTYTAFIIVHFNQLI